MTSPIGAATASPEPSASNALGKPAGAPGTTSGAPLLVGVLVVATLATAGYLLWRRRSPPP